DNARSVRVGSEFPSAREPQHLRWWRSLGRPTTRGRENATVRRPANHENRSVSHICQPYFARNATRARSIDCGLGHDAGDSVPPHTTNALAHIGGGNARSRRMAQSLDLARLPRRKDVKLSIPRRKPDRRPHLDPASTEGREAHIAMPIELSDVVHAQILRSKRTAESCSNLQRRELQGAGTSAKRANNL